jgi:hypothetical protein
VAYWYTDACDVKFYTEGHRAPWGHHIQIFTKCASVTEARFYIAQTLEQGWSRDVLALQLKAGLYARAGKAVTNIRRQTQLLPVCGG